MNARTAVRLAWSLWTVSVSLTASSLVFLALSLSHPGTPVFGWWLGNALVVVEATVGAIVASRRPENPVGWLLCVFGVVVSASSFTSQYAIYALVARPGSLPAGEAVAWVGAWLLSVIIGLQVFYVLLFPTGRLPGRRWRWLAWATATFVVAGAFTSAFAPGAYLGSLGPIRNPLGVEGFTAAYEAILYTMAPLLFGAVAVSVFVRLRRSSGVERQQIKWFAYAAAIYAVSIILNVTILAVETPRWFESSVTVFFTVAGTTIPVSIGIAILRHRLFDIDRIINRTLVYGSLTISLIAVYLAAVAGLQRLLAPLAGENSQLAIVASTLTIAALFNPLRRRLQSFLDRRFYRSKYNSARTLEAFSTRLRSETDIETLSGDLVSVARETVQPERVSLWLRAPDAGSRSTVEQRKAAL
jgi:hypothetical protein